MPALYRVSLTSDERKHLTAITRRGSTSARRMSRARMLLLAHQGRSDQDIANAVGVHPRTVVRLRRRAVEAGVLASLEDRPRPGGQSLLTGPQEALLTALACSDAPEGRTTWTMQLLADRLVELEVVESISDETVRRVLKKVSCVPGANSNGASPR